MVRCHALLKPHIEQLLDVFICVCHQWLYNPPLICSGLTSQEARDVAPAGRCDCIPACVDYTSAHARVLAHLRVASEQIPTIRCRLEGPHPDMLMSNEWSDIPHVDVNGLKLNTLPMNPVLVSWPRRSPIFGLHCGNRSRLCPLPSAPSPTQACDSSYFSASSANWGQDLFSTCPHTPAPQWCLLASPRCCRVIK